MVLWCGSRLLYTCFHKSKGSIVYARSRRQLCSLIHSYISWLDLLLLSKSNCHRHKHTCIMKENSSHTEQCSSQHSSLDEWYSQTSGILNHPSLDSKQFIAHYVFIIRIAQSLTSRHVCKGDRGEGLAESFHSNQSALSSQAETVCQSLYNLV